ncbi:pilus assembly protein CpaB [Oceanobacillus limi]|uniref:Pilus assembly protein CpaB n=1 Tax=Oceanobacillus limi TaxID=930131 RepID=A0A1I0BGZ4_9BACI|nr:Flp pilus assembly protein CpaB [Oceanobacillus limi]SET06083.1 pilus assembly protein CpaB [Oceanobacillus limi]
MKPKKILLLALLSGIITTLLLYFVMNETKSSDVTTEAIVELVQVVIAAEDLEMDQEVTTEQVTLKEVPVESAHPEAISDVNDVVGKYTTSMIKQGEIILPHRIQNKEEEAEVISRKIREGHRAVSIQVDYVTGISNFIQPEDNVDIVLSTVEPVGTEIILERVHVLAVGGRMVEKLEDGTEQQYQAVTLELTQPDMVKVINASERGKLQLALYSKSEPLEEMGTENTDVEVMENELTQVVTIAIKSNIRTAPSLSASVLTIVESNTPLTVLDEQETGKITWYQVETPDQKQGWISNRIVKHVTE